MNVAIVTDSNSGIFEQEGKILGVHVIPMPVILEGKTYYEGIDLTHEEFYQCLEEKREVFSSQPSPAEVLDMWDKLLLSEYDEYVQEILRGIPCSDYGYAGEVRSSDYRYAEPE